MEGKVQNGMTCSEFEALLAEAVEGTLGAAQRSSFEAHRQGCAGCNLMFTEARTGLEWLHGVEDVEPPRHLVHNILAATSGLAGTPAIAGAPPRPRDTWTGRLQAWLGPAWAPILQPRFAMSFAMAFFSVTLVLNVVGFHPAQIHAGDLRPSVVYANVAAFAGQTQGRVVKYYENIRFVYEIESRVRQLKNAADQNTQPDDNRNKDQQQKKQNDNTSGQPDRRRHEEQYSLALQQELLAVVAAPPCDDAVLAVWNRR
jgi:hypothetical protein